MTSARDTASAGTPENSSAGDGGASASQVKSEGMDCPFEKDGEVSYMKVGKLSEGGASWCAFVNAYTARTMISMSTTSVAMPPALMDFIIVARHENDVYSFPSSLHSEDKAV
jgi:hypothetical protein